VDPPGPAGAAWIEGKYSAQAKVQHRPNHALSNAYQPPRPQHDRVRVRAEFRARHDRERFLIIAFRGVYGIGSQGNGDARFMKAIVGSGRTAFDPPGVVLDFSGLEYQWGDMIGAAVDAACSDEIACTIVVGDQCREAMKSYVEAELLDDPAWWLFADLATALTALQARYEPKVAIWRRVRYALAFTSPLRDGEISGLRICDVQLGAEIPYIEDLETCKLPGRLSSR
jgi:hypothetical protein